MWLVSFFLDKPSGCGEALMQAHTRSGCAMRGLLQSDSKWLLFEPASNDCRVLLAFGSNKHSGVVGAGPSGRVRSCADKCPH